MSMIEPEPLQQVRRTYVRLHHRTLSYFSGCDYFRLSSHPRVLARLQQAISQFGLSVSASRLTTGSHRLYGELEQGLARFFGAEAALLVANGYLSNLAAAQAMAGAVTRAFIDERAHPSLQDAMRFLQCPVLPFNHRSPESLARRLRAAAQGGRVLVATDGLFSHDGSIAPLREYRRLLPSNALLLVDDAHGAGVLGAKGRGAVEHERLPRRGLIQTITLSKAFGTFGGGIVGTRALRRRVLERSHVFVGATPMPLPLASAALEAIRICEEDRTLKLRLDRNAAWLKDGLLEGGFNLERTPGPIIALRAQRPSANGRLRRALLKAGIYPPFIKYPGGDANGYFRFVISSEHSAEQLEDLRRVLTSAPVLKAFGAT
jgi:8-amino-7-oxononanoate synthase